MSDVIPRTNEAIREAFRELEFAPSKGMGQNFLCSEEVVRGFVAAAAPEPGDHVVEVGPGLGAISAGLAESGVGLTLIERDSRLARRLGQSFADRPEVTVVEKDVLRIDPRDLLGRGRLKIVGNLPYSISTPLLQMLTHPSVPARRLVFGLQREVADRLAAPPDTRDYGSLTVIMQRCWNIERVLSIPPEAYVPRPRVDSTLVVLTPKRPEEIAPVDAKKLQSLVRRGFAQRRKMLRKMLQVDRGEWEAIAEEIGFDPQTRAEDLGVDQWVSLTNRLHPMPDKRVKTDNELFDIVDETDQVIGQRPRSEVHREGLRHRAVHILITNSKGELYLQRRVPWKDMNPSCWDSSAAGHVDAGETYEEAARRELDEELGLQLEPVEAGRLESSPETGHEFLKIYTAQSDGPFHPAPAEVEWAGFFPLDVVLRWLDTEPDAFSPVFRLCRPILERLALRGRS